MLRLLQNRMGLPGLPKLAFFLSVQGLPAVFDSVVFLTGSETFGASLVAVVALRLPPGGLGPAPISISSSASGSAGSSSAVAFFTDFLTTEPASLWPPFFFVRGPGALVLPASSSWAASSPSGSTGFWTGATLPFLARVNRILGIGLPLCPSCDCRTLFLGFFFQ